MDRREFALPIPRFSALLMAFSPARSSVID